MFFWMVLTTYDQEDRLLICIFYICTKVELTFVVVWNIFQKLCPICVDILQLLFLAQKLARRAEILHTGRMGIMGISGCRKRRLDGCSYIFAGCWVTVTLACYTWYLLDR